MHFNVNVKIVMIVHNIHYNACNVLKDIFDQGVNMNISSELMRSLLDDFHCREVHQLVQVSCTYCRDIYYAKYYGMAAGEKKIKNQELGEKN